ncbi:MAG: O-antigen ligase family protein [Pseudomonadales bacterium]|nr:O-antigen ligase family protein [Candidatus Woesebacteria bacterium]MCB9800792.1 O-antigen ligase family protein [Pseudomonadales bacterium]
MTKRFLLKALAWFDSYFLLVATAFLVGFIPLYPKLPLLDIIPGYIVRMRLEDVLIFITFLAWLVQLIRKKVSIKNPLSPAIGAYVIVAIASTVSAFFITKTVPLHSVHVSKTVLHLIRNIEYFSLFFITLSAVRSTKDVKLFLKIAIGTLITVSLYGIGQKYFYWPVYSTMNREFSKGIRLVLTEHARVQSTFGGHYDLAAYLVLAIPLVVSGLFAAKKRLTRNVLWIALTLSAWLLVVTGARTSFVATFVALGIVLVLGVLKVKQQKVRFFIKYSLTIGLIFTFMLFKYGEDMYNRLLDTLEGFPELNAAYHQTNAARKYYMYEFIPEKLGLTETMNALKIEQPENSITTDELDAVLIKSDQQPIPQKPSDVYVNVPDLVKVATISATGETEVIIVEKERTYSQNALDHGLSMAIRLDTLWPQAWKGFLTNPLLGSGYATLTKSSVYEFTEADSTDNNFLRVLGELGLLGFVAFYGTIVMALWQARNLYIHYSLDELETILSTAYIAGTVGLLINAIFIDVFVSSKVAFTFWMVTGLVIAMTQIHASKSVASSQKKQVSQKRKRESNP